MKNIFNREEYIDIEDYIVNVNKCSYNSVINNAENMMKDSSCEEQIALLDYMIDSLLNEICSTVIVDSLVYYPDGLLQEPFPPLNHSAHTDRYANVNLSKSHIYVRPREHKRTKRALKMLSDTDFKFIRYEHQSLYYPDIDLCYVYNGNHTKGTIESQVVDMSVLFNSCYTDGINWYYSETNHFIQPAFDFRLSAVFTLAQKKYNIQMRRQEFQNHKGAQILRGY